MPSARTADVKSTTPRDPRDAAAAISARCQYDRHARVTVRALRSFQTDHPDGRPGRMVDAGEVLDMPWRAAVLQITYRAAEEVPDA